MSANCGGRALRAGILSAAVGVALVCAPAWFRHSGSPRSQAVWDQRISRCRRRNTQRKYSSEDLEAFEFVNEPYAFTQAGGHPWGLTTKGKFASEEITDEAGEVEVLPTRDPKEIVVDLPPGLLGDPQAMPRCSLTQVTSGKGGLCPADTQIGVYTIHIEGGHELLAPIVNVVPEAGQSAEFALENTTAIRDAAVDGASRADRVGPVGHHGRLDLDPEACARGFRTDVLGRAGRPEPRRDARTCLSQNLGGTAQLAKLVCEGGGLEAGVDAGAVRVDADGLRGRPGAGDDACGFVGGTGERERRR